MKHHLRRPFVAALGALVLVSGCSSAEDESADSPTDTSASDPTTAEPADTATDAAADTAAGTTPEDSAATSAGADDTATSAPKAVLVTSAEGAFVFEMPPGWSDAISEAGAEAVAAARADDRAAGFFTNLVVVAEEPIADLEDSIEESKMTLAGADGAATPTEQIQVDGETGYAFRISRTVQDVQIVQSQRWVEHDGMLYILTMSSARTQQRAAVDTLEEVVRSWSWQ